MEREEFIEGTTVKINKDFNEPIIKGILPGINENNRYDAEGYGVIGDIADEEMYDSRDVRNVLIYDRYHKCIGKTPFHRNYLSRMFSSIESIEQNLAKLELKILNELKNK